MAQAAKQPKKSPTPKQVFDGMKLLELNPRGQYLFVINKEQFTLNDTQELIDLCEKTNLSNVKGALIVSGDVNTAVQLVDINDLSKVPKQPKGGKDGNKASTTK